MPRGGPIGIKGGGEYCFYCGKKLSKGMRTRDHIVPRVAGGAKTPDNIAPACRKCNGMKGSMGLLQFRRRMGVQRFWGEEPENAIWFLSRKEQKRIREEMNQ